MINNKLLYIIFAYYPSGNNDFRFKEDIQQLFQSLNIQNLNNYYILAGDLNRLEKRTEWNNKDNNSKSSLLLQWLSENEITFRINFYASSYPRSGSFIDVCIC